MVYAIKRDILQTHVSFANTIKSCQGGTTLKFCYLKW